MILASFVETAVGVLLRASFQAACLAVIVGVVCKLFTRVPARWRACLWLVVLARLLMPVLPASPVSVWNVTTFQNVANIVIATRAPQVGDAPAWRRAKPQIQTHPVTPTPALSDGPLADPPLADPPLADPPLADPPLADPPLADPPMADPPRRLTFSESVSELSRIAACLWLFGFVPLLGWRIRSALRLHRLLRASQRVKSGPAWLALEACRAELKIGRTVALQVTEQFVTPALTGLISPKIILARKTLDALSMDELAWLFKHELAHVARHDLAVQHLWWLARTLHWFNPLVWWAAARSRLAAELASDEYVLRRASSTEQVSYGHTLLRVAELALDARHAVGTVAFLSRRPALVNRVRGIVCYRQRTRVWSWLAIGIIGGLVVVGLSDAVVTGTRWIQAADPADAISTKHSRTMRIHVVDSDDKPIANAQVHVSVWTDDPFQANRDFQTDADGWVTADLPPTLTILRLWATAPRHVGLFANWDYKWQAHVRTISGEIEAIPAEYVFRLEKGTTVGGTIVNEAGKPIAGAKVDVTLNTLPRDELTKRPVFTNWLTDVDEGPGPRITDSYGRWTLDNVPAGDEVDLSLSVSHPQYVSHVPWKDGQRTKQPDLKSLRDETAKVVLAKGVIVQGVVTDAEGNPLPDAVVVWRDNPYLESGSQEVRTDRHGFYALPPMPKEISTITVVADGWGPQSRQIRVAPKLDPVNFQLTPGKVLRLKFVDEAGEPIPFVHVQIDSWRGGQSLYNYRHPNVLDTRIPTRADSQGVFEWSWAPEDAVLYRFGKRGYREEVESQPYTANGETQTVVLKKEG